MELKSGIIHLDPGIDYDNAAIFLATLRQMDSLSGLKEITVHVTAHGGELMPSAAIVQALKVCQKPVRTVGAGLVASAALPILAAGTRGRRTVLAGTKLVLHHPTHTLGATSRQSPSIEVWQHEVAFHREISDHYYWLLEQCSAKSAEFWRQQLGLNASRFLAVDEALRYGLIDSVTDLNP